MNSKLFFVLIAALNKFAEASADGKITGDELLEIIIASLGAFGISPEFGDLFTYDAADGSVYIKVSSDILKQITIEMDLK